MTAISEFFQPIIEHWPTALGVTFLVAVIILVIIVANKSDRKDQGAGREDRKSSRKGLKTDRKESASGKSSRSAKQQTPPAASCAEVPAFELPHEAAGRRGEEYIGDEIRAVMVEGDHLFSNVAICYGEKEAELDHVVVNAYGVFIIEVKRYSGLLFGEANDFEWKKVHVTKGGNAYEKTEKNPIPQVKREVYILANYLKERGVPVWVEGYAIILGAKNPVNSPVLLKNRAELNRAIHRPSQNVLSRKKVEAVVRILSA